MGGGKGERIKGREGERPLRALLSHGLGSSEAQRVGGRAEGGGRLLLEGKSFTQNPPALDPERCTHTYTLTRTPLEPQLFSVGACSTQSYPRASAAALAWPSWSFECTLGPCPLFTASGPEPLPRFSEAFPTPSLSPRAFRPVSGHSGL